MHFMATSFSVLREFAFKTSEKVPSPFLLNNLYSLFFNKIEMFLAIENY